MSKSVSSSLLISVSVFIELLLSHSIYLLIVLEGGPSVISIVRMSAASVAAPTLIALGFMNLVSHMALTKCRKTDWTILIPYS